MGIFGNSSPFDQDVERATSEHSTSEEWGLIMDICDRAGASPAAARDCLRAALRRLAHADPHVQVAAATLLDACVANCGRHFLLEVASRDFETEFRRLLARAQPPVARRLRQLLRKWADNEFRGDPQLDLIPSLHAKLRAEAGEAPSAAAPAAAAAAAAAASTAASASTAAQREQEELARAIALSLRESGAPAAAAPTGGVAAAAAAAAAAASAAAATAAPLYPRAELAEAAPAVEARKVRALYDFEAAEDNELTFMAGEIVHVTESSDPNWWKGYNERGEGLFPANFVTADLGVPRRDEPAPAARAAAAPAAERVEIEEGAMDAALALLHEADPEAAADGGGPDDAHLARLEARALAMGPLVDAALERADRRHARLTQLSAALVDALNLYHSLMRPPLQPPPPPPPQHQAGPPPPPPPSFGRAPLPFQPPPC